MAKAWENMAKRRTGFFIYNATMHVPLIIRLPENRLPENAAARTVGDPVSLVDLMPTILGAVGLGVPSQVQGRSLLPELYTGHDRDKHDHNDQAERDRGSVFSMEKRSCRGFTLTGVSCGVRKIQNITSSTRLDPSCTICRRIQEKFTICSQIKVRVAEEMRAKLYGLIRNYSAGKEWPKKPAWIRR